MDESKRRKMTENVRTQLNRECEIMGLEMGASLRNSLRQLVSTIDGEIYC